MKRCKSRPAVITCFLQFMSWEGCRGRGRVAIHLAPRQEPLLLLRPLLYVRCFNEQWEFSTGKDKKRAKVIVQLKSNIFFCSTEGKFGPRLQCSFNWLFPYGLTFWARVMLMQLKPKQILIPVLIAAEIAPLCVHISYILLQLYSVFWGISLTVLKSKLLKPQLGCWCGVGSVPNRSFSSISEKILCILLIV